MLPQLHVYAWKVPGLLWVCSKQRPDSRCGLARRRQAVAAAIAAGPVKSLRYLGSKLGKAWHATPPT
jgi:hypothetical protein